MERFSKVNFEINDLSAEDFQEKLYQWLEEQGILPGLRTYLRHQLVSALKRTHLSSDFLNKKRNNLSVKDASLNLLIAEYLVQQNYQYTASIFYSEEPRLGQLPIQLRLSNEGGESSKFFSETEVEEILQSLNIVHISEFVREVVDSYSKHSTSLLKAIVKSFAVQSKKFQHKKPDSLGDACAEEEYSTVKTNERDHKKSAEKVDKLQAFRNQLGKSMAQDKEDSSSTSESKQSEINKRVEDAVMKMKEEMEREMAEQRKTMEDGLMAKQQRILEMVNQLQDQQIKLQDHFNNMKEKEKLLDLKEKRFEGMQHQESIRIAEEHNEIKSSQQKLEEEFQRLRQEKNAFILLQKEMEATHKQIIEVANYLGNSQMELDVIQSLNLEDKQKMESKGTQPNKMNGISSCGTMTLTQSLRSMQENTIQVYQRAVNELREKNVKLQSLANEQQSKINKLSVTVSSLSSHLEDATAALRLLSAADDNKTKMQPIESHLTFPVKEKFEQEEPDGEHREKQYERSFKRSNEKRIRRREESDSSIASSPTEEILREARHRLQKLEFESDEVDRRYYKFKQKHLLEGFRITSLNLSQDKLSSPERNKSLTKYSHKTGTHNSYEKQRSISELDYAYPIENNPMNEKQVSFKFTSNHSEYDKKAENFKEKSDSKLSNKNGGTQVISIASHTSWIGCSNKKVAENYRESSTPINEVQKEITPLSEQLPSERDDSEVLKEETPQKNYERHSVEKNFPYTPTISDNLTHEVYHQTALETADKNPEMKIEGQINSTTGNQYNYVAGKSTVVSAGEEVMNKQMKGSNDSLTSSSAKISVGTNCGKADDSFW